MAKLGRILVAGALALGLACAGEIATRDGTISPPDSADRDLSRDAARDGSPDRGSPKEGGGQDLPANPGDPCYGVCAGAMICIAGRCTPTCTAGACNEKAPECSGKQACIQASDFTDACYDPDAHAGEYCDSEYICEGGTFCAQGKCRRLCQYGCSGSCVRVKGCDVCMN